MAIVGGLISFFLICSAINAIVENPALLGCIGFVIVVILAVAFLGFTGVLAVVICGGLLAILAYAIRLMVKS